jgi:hypothetical protein
MCSRFTQTKDEIKLAWYEKIHVFGAVPRYNIASFRLQNFVAFE